MAIYRNERGQVIHSAQVVDRDAKGHVLVNTKSGSRPEEHHVWADRVLVREIEDF